MQRLWLRAWLKRDDVRSAEIERWLWRIAQNLLREFRREQARKIERRVSAIPSLARELAGRFETEEIPLDVLNREEVRDQLLLALTELPSAEQDLLVARYFEGRSQCDLAQYLGISQRAVEGRLYRARLAMRNKLQHLNHEE